MDLVLVEPPVCRPCLETPPSLADQALSVSQSIGTYSIILVNRITNWFFGGDGEGEFQERQSHASVLVIARITWHGHEILLCMIPGNDIHRDSKMNDTTCSCATSQP